MNVAEWLIGQVSKDKKYQNDVYMYSTRSVSSYEVVLFMATKTSVNFIGKLLFDGCFLNWHYDDEFVSLGVSVDISEHCDIESIIDTILSIGYDEVQLNGSPAGLNIHRGLLEYAYCKDISNSN